jgi:hypothetical protein
MIRNFKILHRSIALVIIGAFVYVQANALTCGINHLIDAAGLAHHHPFGHDHHHDHESIPEDHHHDAGKHDENEKNCCSDFTQTFLSAFTKSPVSNAEFSFKQTCIVVELPHSVFSQDIYFHPKDGILSSPPLPPPKIPDIRVFIRSFQV